MNSHRSILTSEGIVPGPSGTVIRRSHRTVGSNRSATTDPFPPLPSDLPMPPLTTWLLSRDSPVSPASLRQGIHNFPSFEGSSDLWIFRLDRIPMRCDMPRSMFDHPHSLFPNFAEFLTFFAQAQWNCPLYHHMVWGLGLSSSTLISSALELTFVGHCSHIVQTSLLM